MKTKVPKKPQTARGSTVEEKVMRKMRTAARYCDQKMRRRMTRVMMRRTYTNTHSPFGNGRLMIIHAAILNRREKWNWEKKKNDVEKRQ